MVYYFNFLGVKFFIHFISLLIYVNSAWIVETVLVQIWIPTPWNSYLKEYNNKD